LEAARLAAEKEAKRAAAKAAAAAKKGAPAAGAKAPAFGAKKVGLGAAVVDEIFSTLQTKNALKRIQESSESAAN